MSDLVVIQRKIYEIRGQRVILDRDLAALYQVETRVLNQAVKRNIERFPDDFMFQLTKEEVEFLKSQIVILEKSESMSSQIVTTSHENLTSQNVISNEENLRSQIVTLKKEDMRGKHVKFLPYAFTEHGVVMLASLLRSEIAIAMSVQITRAFVAMRQTIAALATTETKIELLNEKVERLNMYIEEILHDQNDINEETTMQLELINQSLAELQAQKHQAKPRRRIGYDVSPDEEYID